jgi:hypothetical protein
MGRRGGGSLREKRSRASRVRGGCGGVAGSDGGAGSPARGVRGEERAQVVMKWEKARVGGMRLFLLAVAAGDQLLLLLSGCPCVGLLARVVIELADLEGRKAGRRSGGRRSFAAGGRVQERVE